MFFECDCVLFVSFFVVGFILLLVFLLGGESKDNKTVKNYLS